MISLNFYLSAISDSFHVFRYIWDEENLAFLDPSQERLDLCQKMHEICYICALKKEKELLAECKKTDSSLSIYGKHYHKYDFVYWRREYNGLLAVAQITDLMHDEDGQLQVQLFLRYSDVVGSQKATSAASQVCYYLYSGELFF